jgi:hypothetical protein
VCLVPLWTGQATPTPYTGSMCLVSRITHRIADCFVYGIAVILIVVRFMRLDVRGVFIFVLLSLFIVGADQIRRRSTRQDLLYQHFFVLNPASVADPNIYFSGLVAKCIVLYQFVALFTGKPLF